MPILYTEKWQESIAFYTEFLGGSCAVRDDEQQWAIIQLGPIELMLCLPNAHQPYSTIGCSGSYYFEMEEVISLWEKTNRTATIVYPLETFSWGMQEFAIKDVNGYVLQFGASCS